MSELKPCPFCGSSAQIVSSWSHHSNEYGIQCSGDAFEEDRNYGCPACNNEQDEQGGFGFSYISTVKGDKERVIEIWNTRPIEDQLKAENERLRGMLREIANSAGEDACGYTSGEGHVDCIWKARRALNEVTK